MRSFVLPICLIVAFADMAAAVQPALVPDPGRTVSLELREDDQLVAAERLTVRAGRPAALSAGAFALRLRMDPIAPGTGQSGAYMVRSTLYRAGSGALLGSPALRVETGEPAHLRFRGSDGSDLELAVTVQ
ncbi:hypothetical protein [Sphingosinicella terrae]|jgi:hypothetical protein|uniref:hypothetical protein n=1 Tax=Sphingosinicella terrae TaxID=2172047 RepID=UPI000E0D86DE|nr:hypothetical protein [Sphingosinicella terrae]